MILAVHATFGAAVASLVPSHPVAGFALGFVYLCRHLLQLGALLIRTIVYACLPGQSASKHTCMMIQEHAAQQAHRIGCIEFRVHAFDLPLCDAIQPIPA